VQEAARALGSDVSLVSVQVSDCIGRVYDRLNQDYRPLHGLARFFLEHTASDLGEASTGVPFTLNMAELFERFVAAWLHVHLPANLHLKVQHRMVAGDIGRFDSFVDLMIVDTTGHVVAVLDTKYKDAADPSRSDLHQVVYYATGLACKDAFLVYPNPAAGFDVPVGPKRVRSIAFDLGKPITVGGPAFLSGLLAALG
jgi:5-methylcytosine-specific restriction enzyme subunit McrC